MTGFVQINRAIWSNVDFEDGEMTQREAFMWMIAHAAWKPTPARVGKIRVDLERGQLAYSVRFMAEKFGWSKSRVHRFLGALENRDSIGTASGTGVCVITICNYDKYQLGGNKIGTADDAEAGQQRDSSGTKKNTLNTNNTIISDTDVSEGDRINNEIEIAFDGFCTMARKHGWTVPRDLTKTRKAALRARLKENTLTGWGVVLRRASQSDLLASSSWFGIDWLLKPANLQKVKEGNYDNRGSDRGAASGARPAYTKRNAGVADQFAAFADQMEASASPSKGHGRGAGYDAAADTGVIIDADALTGFG